MYKILRLASLLTILIPCGLIARTAEDYFHSGAQHYAFGETQKAKDEITTGLSQYPEDPKLQNLARLLNEKQPEEPPQSKNQNSEEQNQQENEKQQDPARQQQKDPQQQADQKQQEQQQQQQQQQQDQQQGQQQKPGEPKEGESGEEEGQAVAAGEMSVQQALQFLEAQKQQDRTLIFAPPPDQKPKKSNVPLKDW